MNARVLQKDWSAFYNQRVCLLESFVDTTRFKGTCYRAANWSYIGDTKGRGKYDRYNRQEKPIKAVFVYPFSRYFQEQLRA